MNFNSLVFPAPKPSYNSEILGNELIWIPNYKHPEKKKTDNKYNSKKINLNRIKNENNHHNLTDHLSEEINIENPLPNYMTPQASIAKKFDFNSYNKKYCSNEPIYHNSSKSKINGNKATILEANSYSNENYDEKEEDFRPKNLEKYYTRTLDKMNVFTKYSSNNYEPIASTAANQKKIQVFDHSFKQISYIPSLLLEFPSNPNPEHIVLFFHGNGEDIYLAYELIDSIRNTLKVRILAPEYPSYGVYNNVDCTAEKILSDAENCYNYLLNVIGYQEDHIIIMGRSIGTGPATWLAANKNPAGLVLISGFTSLQGVVQGYAGSIKHLLKERFLNLENMKRIECPTLLIHGMKDKLIPYSHSLKLHDACKGPCELQLPKEMSHFEFDFEEDMSFPILLFLEKWGYGLKQVLNKNDDMQTPNIFPIEVYFKPYK